jgi:hypothetical protein
VLRLVRDDVPIEGRLFNLEGRPIAGLEVRTLHVEDPSNPQPIYGAPSGFFQAATTGPDGRFHLAGIGRGRRALLGIAGPGIARDHVQVVTGSFPKDRPPHWGKLQYGSRFEHPCKPGKSISGVVRDLDAGAPLAGIRVLSYMGNYTFGNTDEQGRYRLDGVSKQPTYHLVASARESDQPYVTSVKVVADSTDYQPLIADLNMARGVVVSGRLMDRASGRPVQAWVAYAALRDNPHWARVPGFELQANRYHPDPWRHVPSIADGSFRLVVLPGRGLLVAHFQYQSDRYIPAGVHPRGRPDAPPDALEVRYDTVPFELFTQNFPAVLPIDIAPGTRSATYDLTLDSGVVRSGTVLDPEGRPLPGASVIGETFRNTHQFIPLVGSGFTVYGLSPSPLLPRTVIFRHLTRGLGKAVRIDLGDRGPLEVRLEPLAAVTGRLVDEAGQPLEGVELQLLRQIHEPLRGAQPEFSPPLGATTDRDGRFRLEGIVPGVTHNLQANGIRAGSVDFLLEDWTPRGGEVKDLGQVAPGRGR